ncbi:MAG: pilus assembly PilX N-terminal domain-containing protein [Victivallaceae bacterium]|nr:pilus assembly PilX N-terminal domain-containing protein [Victivallaceae bacterium]
MTKRDMQKSVAFFSSSPRDRGVALLFALGILSALMLLGIAFMGSSLFSRRIAENRSNATEAMILARSTANLVIGAVDAFHQAYGSSGKFPLDYRSIFSVGDPGGHSPDHDKYGEFLRRYIRGGRSDYSRLDVYSLLPYHGGDSSAQWVYVRNRDGEITGRYAYQVLPTPGYGRLNLFHTLTGPFKHQEQHPGAIVNASDSVPVYNDIANEARRGQTTAELNFEDVGELDKLDGDSSPNSTKNFTKIEEVPANLLNLYASEAIFSEKNNSAKSRIGRAWMESTFTEGTNPGFREVAPGNYGRFNLAAVDGADPWYSRFFVRGVTISDSQKNTSDILDQLTQLMKFNTMDFERDSDLSPTDSNETLRRPGLAFLRCIGDDSEKGSFADIKDLRHQIAANFNDYCDSDSIPTSDLPSASWSPDNAPKYTGNEKTLYINEIFYGAVGTFSINSSDRASVDFAADLIWGGELVDIYGNDDQTVGPNISAAGYTLSGGIQNANAEIRLGATLRCTYHVNVTRDGTPTSDPSQTITETFTADELNLPKTVSWGSASASIGNFAHSDPTGTPYKIATVDTESVFQATPVSWDFNDQSVREKLTTRISARDGFSTQYEGVDHTVVIDEIQVEEVTPTIDSFTIIPKNMVLNDGSNNVDYTNMNGASIAIPSGEIPSTSVSIQLGVSGQNTLRLFIGGIEAKDPRQNLNVNPGASGAATDWSWSPRLIILNDSASANIENSGATINRKDVPNEPDDPKEISAATTAAMIDQLQAMHGRVNSGASPKNDDDDSYDKETVSDPGWTPTNMISTAVIRNAPMKSPWELGFIHRGIQFQTINLKKANDSPDGDDIPNDTSADVWGSTTTGTTYANGDGGILDWIRMTETNFSDGKINLNQFGKEKTTEGLSGNKNRIRYQIFGDNAIITLPDDVDSSDWATLDTELLTALFNNVPMGTAQDFVISNTSNNPITLADARSLASDLYTALNGTITSGNLLTQRSEVLLLTGIDWTQNKDNDAQQEELIGRTINLLTATAEPPAVFRAVIIAQSIKDIGDNSIEGIDAVSSDHPNADLQKTKLGRFDMGPAQTNPRDNIHYDVITGEAKILVTYERNPVTGQVIIRDIENIE